MTATKQAAENALKAGNDALYILGGKYENRFAVAAQFILEKGWDWWENPHGDFNPGNVTNGSVEDGFPEFPDLVQGLERYAHVLLTTSFDEGATLVYKNVVDQMRYGVSESVVQALCDSPYCSPPYDYHTLWSIMVKLIDHEYPTVSSETDEEYYTVQRGDCLWSIAQAEFGDGRLWTRIADLNTNLHGVTIYEGDKVRIR